MKEQAFFEFLSELSINLNKKYKQENWENLYNFIREAFPKDRLPLFSHLLTSLIQLKKNEEFAIFSNRTSELIHQINLEVSKLAPLNKILHLSIERLRHISRADIISIQLFDKDKKTFHIEAATGFPNNLVPSGTWDASEKLNDILSTEQKIIVCPNLSIAEPIDSEFINTVFKPQKILSYLTSPLIVNNNYIGFIIMARYKEYASSNFKVNMLERYSSQTAIAVQNIQLYTNEKNLLQFHIDLLNLLLEDGYEKIIYKLHEFLSIDTLLIDENGHIITYALTEHSNESSDFFSLDYAKYLKGTNSDSSIYFTINQINFQTVPIKLNDSSFYYLIFFEHLDFQKSFTLLAIEQTKTIIALKYAQELNNFEIEKKLRQDYIYELLFNLDSTEELIRRGRFFKFPFNQETYILTILFDTGMPENIANKNAEKIRNSLPLNITKYSIVHSSKLILIIPASNLKDIVKLLSNNIQKYFTNKTFSIGVSSSVLNAEDYPKGFEESKKCAIFGREVFKKTVIYYEELGIIGLLFDSSNYKNIIQFKTQYLGPLIESDKNHQTDYIKTLDCYLENESVVKTTSEKLHVHYNTVRYRLAKIEELLQIDLNNNFNRLNLQLALTIERMLSTNLT